MADVIQIDEAWWAQQRAIRLQALEADPSAFGSTLERELGYPEDRWRGWLRSGACFLAVEGQAPVGMIVVRDREVATEAEINAMWVNPEFRGAGIAGALVRAALDWAGRQRRQLVRLWVTTGNDAAIQLYEKIGFSRSGAEEPLASDPQLTMLEFILALAPPARPAR